MERQVQGSGKTDGSILALHASCELRRFSEEHVPTGPRRQARIVALQSLYEYDTALHDPVVVLERHIQEKLISRRVADFARELIEGVGAHLEPIDLAIQKAAQEWPIGQMAKIDKNILRLAIFEMKYGHQVPAKAAINEAVDLAKLFGSETSSKFINGVLGTIFSRTV